MKINFSFNLKKAWCAAALGTILVAACCGTAAARWCFGKNCPHDDRRNIQTCIGYNLTQTRGSGYCADGWNCDSCLHVNGHNYYKCEAKETPAGYTAGLMMCKVCEDFTYNGCTGDRINGKCTSKGGEYSPENPGHCMIYKTPDYTIGVRYSDGNMAPVIRNDCYTDVIPLSGGDYKPEKPASCMTYDKKEGSDGVMCYANALPIGEYYSTEKRDETIFKINTKSGTDEVPCYRAEECNTENGWRDISVNIDENVFIVSSETADGITCRKATDCNEANHYFKEKPDEAFASTSVTESGLTCYAVSGCADGGYSDTKLPSTCEGNTAVFYTDTTYKGLSCWERNTIECDEEHKCSDGACENKTCADYNYVNRDECTDSCDADGNRIVCAQHKINDTDVCAEKVKYTCDDDKKCSDGKCIAKTCSDYGNYVDECTNGCNSAGTGVVTCTEEHPRDNLTCYIGETVPCTGGQVCENGACITPSCADGGYSDTKLPNVCTSGTAREYYTDIKYNGLDCWKKNTQNCEESNLRCVSGECVTK